MSFAKQLPLYGLLLIVPTLLVPFTSAQTPPQNSDSTVAPIQKVGSRSESSVSEADDMEQLKAQVKQLQLQLEQQQRTIAEVQKRLTKRMGKRGWPLM